MRGAWRALAALLLLAAAVPARAQEWTRAYGGTGDECLWQAIPVEDGLLAVGRTASADGTLSMRKRTGETGWALRLSGEGDVLWNYCTAHVGRSRMGAPHLHADGTLSCALWGEGRGWEWLRLSADGKLLARIEVPQTLCDHDAQAEVTSCLPGERDGKPQLAVTLRHADGTACAAAMDESGDVRKRMQPFACAPYGVKIASADGSGRVAYLTAADGCAQMTAVQPGEDAPPQRTTIPIPKDGALDVLSALALADGSVVFGGQRDRVGGYIARVNAQGEAVFCYAVEETPFLMALTPTGFACYDYTGGLHFFDEDGRPLGSKQLPAAEREARGDYADAMVGLDAGVALVFHTQARREKQAVVMAVSDAGLEPPAADYEEDLYAQMESRLLAARKDGEDVLMLIEREDGQRMQMRVTAQGGAWETAATLSPAEKNARAFPQGTLSWEKASGGAQVAWRDAQGRTLWQTRTRIHTAADALEWYCAERLADGSFLLGGRYVTEMEDHPVQHGALAHLSADGVLMDVRMSEEVGCFCDLLAQEGRVYALVSVNSWVDDGAHGVLALEDAERPEGHVRFLNDRLEKDGAYLLPGAGCLYAAGTSLVNGRRDAVLQRVELRP